MLMNAHTDTRNDKAALARGQGKVQNRSSHTRDRMGDLRRTSGTVNVNVAASERAKGMNFPSKPELAEMSVGELTTVLRLCKMNANKGGRIWETRAQSVGFVLAAKLA